jgi:hypothetical protein
MILRGGALRVESQAQLAETQFTTGKTKKSIEALTCAIGGGVQALLWLDEWRPNGDRKSYITQWS